MSTLDPPAPESASRDDFAAVTRDLLKKQAPGRAPRHGLRRVQLGPARPARFRHRRPWPLVPRWLTDFERELSLEIARRVLPRLPWLARPYSRQLLRQLTVVEGEIGSTDLPPAWCGARILLVSDLHAGPMVEAGALRLALHTLQELRPDVIVVAGDILTSAEAELEWALEALSGLDAPLGVWAALGNHDHYAGPPAAMTDRLEQLGIRLIVNDSAELQRGSDTILLGAIDDWTSGRPELAAVFPAASRQFKLLISHNPDAVFDAAEHGVDLILSGHTHGGQIRWPHLPPPVSASQHRLTGGHYTLERGGRQTQLVVSQGLGVVGLPVRIGCPPEATLIRLRRRR